LPEAHVEAPTVGSVLLAGIILKLAFYGFLRFLIGFSFFIAVDLIFFIYIIAFIGFFFSSMVALNQIDIKKIIAYSSIAHMNFAIFGFFSQSLLGFTGSFYMLFGHAITSSALFFCIGILYDRYKTRLLFYYGALATFMPIFSVFFFIFVLSNFGFPGTINFVGEFLISVGGFFLSPSFFLFTCFPLILSLIYSLNLFIKVFYGTVPFFLRYYSDLMRLEFSVLFFLFFFVFFGGLFPNFLFSFFIFSIKKLSIFCFF
jgi:NADH:ubiquinone oxidoreductase subunit 4 (subunit M)